MQESHLELNLPDPEATLALGAALARAYRGGSCPRATIYLQGDLGSGKTTCVRGLLRSLGVAGAIRSPTYTLVEVYTPAGITCVHVDLYRLQGVSQVEELGLRDFLDEDCLLLVEWPERAGAALPPADLKIAFHYQGQTRRVELTAASAGGGALLQVLSYDASLTSYVSNIA